MLGRFTTQMMKQTVLPAMKQQTCAFAHMSGQVKNFDNRKGFGFIMPQDGSLDVFVHQTEIRRSGFRYLIAGEEVEFELEETERGRKAFNVTGPDGAELPAGPPRSDDSMGNHFNNDRSRDNHF